MEPSVCDAKRIWEMIIVSVIGFAVVSSTEEEHLDSRSSLCFSHTVWQIYFNESFFSVIRVFPILYLKLDWLD